MQSLFALAAPLALLFPILGLGDASDQPAVRLGEENSGPLSPAPDFGEPPEGQRAETRANPLDAFFGGQVVRQVRIEQRVVIRISPQRQGNRNSLLAQLPQRPLNSRYEEREMDRCIPVNRISGVQTGNGNRLLLFMRDQRILSINLERACRARDFYSGFYIERNEDGQLCVDRDELQSRSGARCEVERMSELIAVEE